MWLGLKSGDGFSACCGGGESAKTHKVTGVLKAAGIQRHPLNFSALAELLTQSATAGNGRWWTGHKARREERGEGG